ncbi:cytochrome P450 [Cryobacterium sp. PH31-O1]|uniref:cytochrome P450 n=1 Tax=Cryobacterium sp. PH31-O1 TaxID=3046306 RepID=UPI0024BBC37B|nr:cytochrome P450 [Cryobacterium sp. PH31-O1]MDJ0339573.1 cytochrome P450 [Cryobacterium sp. PH31-O1]
MLHDPVAFGPANALVAVKPLTGPSLRLLQRARFALPPILASNADDRHAGIRRVVGSFFTPATVAAIEPRIRELARAAVTVAARAVDEDGSVDLVEAVAARPPAILMLELLGLPVRDVAQLKTWSRESLELFWGWPDDERQLRLAGGAAEFYTWLRTVVREAVGADRRTLFGSLAEHGLSTPELCSLGYFLLIAGQETTTQLISTALFRLAANPDPDAWRKVATPAGASALVRRVLATESSVPTWRRVTTRAVELDGETLPAGCEILLELTGNHGTRARPTAYSLAFGSGIHRCLGAKLAELEATVVVQETARTLPPCRLGDASPEWTRLLSFQSPRTVTVTRR